MYVCVCSTIYIRKKCTQLVKYNLQVPDQNSARRSLGFNLANKYLLVFRTVNVFFIYYNIADHHVAPKALCTSNNIRITRRKILQALWTSSLVPSKRQLYFYRWRNLYSICFHILRKYILFCKKYATVL